MLLTSNLLFRIPALLLAITFHEFAHGFIAYKLGDSTAKSQGRLTLNPLVHLDPLGALALLLVGFGWAKPVPVNPMYFKGDRHRGMFLVGLAGPIMNFLLAFFIMLVLSVYRPLFSVPYLADILYTAFMYNIFLGVFNLLPVPPLDGSRVLSYLLPANARYTYNSLEQYGPLLLMLLIFLPFNFLGKILYPMANLAGNIIFAVVGFLTGGF